MSHEGTALHVCLNTRADALSIDLTVMGTHGRTGLARVVLGSVAEAVVRAAPCPVLTVHSAESATIDAASGGA